MSAEATAPRERKLPEARRAEGELMPAVLIHRVIARLNVGGPAMHVVNLARALEGERWRTRLVAGRVADGEGDMAYYAGERGVAVTFVGALSREISPLADLRTLWSLFRLFRRERPTIVHTHTAKAGTLGRLAAVLAGVPIRIHTYHGHVLGGGYFPAWKTRLFLEIERQLARGTHRLVVLTERQADEMASELGVARRHRFAVVPLGLDLDGFAGLSRAPYRARTRAALEIPPEALVVGIVGRLVPIKNHELFLHSVAKLRTLIRGPMVALVVGSGEREAELAELAGTLLPAGEVRWLGWRKDLPELNAAMDVMALTSHDEGTPVALLEALAAGTPVVARDVGGVAEVLSNVGAGRVLPREAGPDEWAAALADVGMGRAPDPGVREHVARTYSVERLAGDLAALYREEMAGRAGSRGLDAHGNAG